ncbi:MAG: hypothetical protein K6E10_10120 [Eubacterium sp.]|nr:hypothetical protein [Eubacterium sp.]
MKEKIKEYLIELCLAYTFVSVTGAIVNILAGTETNNINVLVMFISCAIATFVLFLHNLFDKLSPLAMMIIQYFIAAGLIAVMLVFINVFVDHITPRGWFEYYRSFTIPYIILAGFYYYRVFSETKVEDDLIKEIQSKREG